jgi:hypothetical protein
MSKGPNKLLPTHGVCPPTKPAFSQQVLSFNGGIGFINISEPFSLVWIFFPIPIPYSQAHHVYPMISQLNVLGPRVKRQIPSQVNYTLTITK